MHIAPAPTTPYAYDPAISRARHSHSIVAQLYDVLHFNTKSAVFPEYLHAKPYLCQQVLRRPHSRH